MHIRRRPVQGVRPVFIYHVLFWAYLTLPSTTLKRRYRFVDNRGQRHDPGTGFRKDPIQGQVQPLSLNLTLPMPLYLNLTLTTLSYVGLTEYFGIWPEAPLLRPRH